MWNGVRNDDKTEKSMVDVATWKMTITEENVPLCESVGIIQNIFHLGFKK